MKPLQLEPIRAGGDCSVLRIEGKIDVYTAPELRECVIDLIGSGVRYLIADLRRVEFLDSTGLGALVGSLKRLRTCEGSLTLVTSAGRIQQIFRITGLDRAFALHPSVPDAMNADQHWHGPIASEGLSAAEWCRQHGLL